MSFGGPSYDLKVTVRGRVRCELGWHLGRDWAKSLKDYDLWYIWKGRGQMKLDSEEIELRPGVCLWMRPGCRYEARQDASDRLGVNYIHFSFRKSGKILPLSDFEPPFEVLRTCQVEFVDTMMRRIIDLGVEPDSDRSAAKLLDGLLTELGREHAASLHLEAPGTEQHHREVVFRTAALIRESPGQTVTIAELALNAGYSVDHFSRIFQKIMGLRPQNYIIQAKIERARQLLAESDLTVGAIAEIVGFQEIFYFSRQFRQKTGQTPTEFRRSLRAS